MPYFIVAAGFILAVALLATITLLSAIVPGLRSGFAYAWRVWLWSSLGCVVANVPVFALYFVPGALERTGTTPAPGFGRSVLSVVLAGGLLLATMPRRIRSGKRPLRLMRCGTCRKASRRSLVLGYLPNAEEGQGLSK